jgi:eukaryotic-like serine/threonine-protein kinase
MGENEEPAPNCAETNKSISKKKLWSFLNGVAVPSSVVSFAEPRDCDAAMTSSHGKPALYRFGTYEANSNTGELLKKGVRIKLQEQPFRMLCLLLEKSGSIISKEEVRERLWPGNTFVEFDASLSVAIGKLRDALGDDAENPRFIETVPRRGYRFLAAVVKEEIGEGEKSNGMERALAAQESAQQPNVRGDVLREEQTAEVQKGERGRWRYLLLFLGAAALGAVLGTYFYRQQSMFALTARDTIVVADFQNSTGEPVFSEALRRGLQVGLEQSPFLQVLSDRKMAVILKQMERPPDERITGPVTVEVCRRSNSRAAVEGSISLLGNAYLLGLTAIRCDTGEAIIHEQWEAKRREDVINELGAATARLRERLGESLQSIQKYNAPLAQATTSSLEALNAYGVAFAKWERDGDTVVAPSFLHAIVLDPNFAMAYSELAAVYQNRGETELARQNATRAYQLRDRVTRFEKLSIESQYDARVIGDLEKAARDYEIILQEFPNSPTALNDLGSIYGELGRYDKAESDFRQALELLPEDGNLYANLSVVLLALGKQSEADTILERAEQRKLRTSFLLQARYWSAFLRGDTGAMQRTVQESRDIPGAYSDLLSEEADTHAYFGQMNQSRELTTESAGMMSLEGDRAAAAGCWLEAALREAEFGDRRRGREDTERALKMANDVDVRVLAAVVLAHIGDITKATALSEGVMKERAANTLIQNYWLPLIRGELALQRGKWPEAIEMLRVAAPFDKAAPSALTMSTLYPAYARGEAYLGIGDGARAAVEFQEVIEHRGMVLNFPLGALAYLGRGRSYALAGDAVKARQDYETFFALWKDADPDLPVLKQARAESQNNFAKVSVEQGHAAEAEVPRRKANTHTH